MLRGHETDVAYIRHKKDMLLGHETDVAYIRHPLKMEQSPCVAYTQLL